MLNDRELSAAIGSTAYDPDGDKIGTVEHFFVDDRTGAPTWVAVTTGLFGTRHSIVPAVDASFADGDLRVPVSRDAVKRAPSVAGTEHLDPAEEAALRQHYGLAGATDAPPAPGAPVDATATAESTAAASTATADSTVTAGSTAPADRPAGSGGSMTRSEEQLRVHTEEVAATRVRLVKYVVTEQVQVTVPVRREEIRIEEVPIGSPDPGPGESLVADGRHAQPDDAADGRLPDEIILHREEPVVSVRVVPAERVRLRTEMVQGQEQVGAQLQREQITVDEEAVAPRTQV
jgi:stress response protein YsnF